MLVSYLAELGGYILNSKPFLPFFLSFLTKKTHYDKKLGKGSAHFFGCLKLFEKICFPFFPD